MISYRAPAVQLPYVALRFAVCVLLAAFSAAAQQSPVPENQPRIPRILDQSQFVPLTGNVHPLAQAKYDLGAAADTQPLHRMLLVLSRSSAREAALRSLLDEQQTPGSPNYHKWLTPAQFGDEFGPEPAVVQTVTNWLASQGFEVARTANSKTIIEFNGTAGQVLQAFHAEIHKYAMNGKQYWANANDPQIPAALASVVKGFASLNNFPRRHYSRAAGNFRRDQKTGEVTPELTTSNGYYGLAPGDFATIYNSLPLLTAGNDGSGQTIALVGETDINPSDIANFRSTFGLGTGNTQVILDGPDPGLTSVDEEQESDLDVEWSSAVAPGATVDLVESASTEVTQGIDLSALYIVENNLAGVMSESYGNCEANLGTGNLFFSYLWEQAAAQGITVVISSGDSSAAGCDSPQEEAAVNGLAVNGIASTPFNVVAGGTDYNDGTSLATYWTSTNGSVTAGNYTLPYVSAQSYIPEMTWNYSCADAAQPGSLDVCDGQSPGIGGLLLVGAGGGRSSCGVGTSPSCTGYSKPSWQMGVTANDGVRDLPDISFFSSAGDSSSKSFYVICQTDALPAGEAACVPNNGSISFSGVGGTSAAAPTFAGTVALAMQKAGSRLGNINYLLYPVAQSSPSSFHDVTVGNISVPCSGGSRNCSSQSGATGVLIDASSNPAYAAAPGYDLATGLGAPNITNLVNAVATAANARSSTTTTLDLNGGAGTVTAAHGAPITVAINVSNASGTGTGPAGDVAVMSSTGIAIDGTSPSNSLVPGNSGQSSVSWSSTLFPGGSYSAFANYSGDGGNAASKSGNVSVSITPESSQVFAILEQCSGSSITAILVGSATVSYGGCYFMRYDVADSAATFLGMVVPVVSSKCSNGTASCPTGSVAVTDNGAPLDGGTIMLNPHATAEDFQVQLTGGTHTVAASYPGDPSYHSSSGSISVTVTKVNPLISQPTSQPTSPTANQSVQLVANVTTGSGGAPPTGTVTFYDNGTAMTGTLVMTGTAAQLSAGASTLAVLTTSFSAVGSHSVTAQYNGDVNYNSTALSPALTVMVSGGQLVPTVTVPTVSVNPAPAGSAVTLVTTVSPASGSGGTTAPTGTVAFLDGSTALTGTVNYATTGATLTATLSYTFTSAGSHSITAQYAGDSNYKTATSSALSLTVNQPYTLSLDQTSITKSGGGSGVVTLTLSPASGFSGQVDVSCVSGSSQATCTPTANAPATVTVNSGSNTTAPVNYTVPAQTGAVQQHISPWMALGGTVMAGFVLLGASGRRRGRWMFTIIALASACILISCGGGSGGGRSTPVTYTFTVKAAVHSNASVSSTAQFTVTVP